MGTRTLKRDKNGNKMETKWEQEPESGNKAGNPKVRQEWEEQSGNKVGTKTPSVGHFGTTCL